MRNRASMRNLFFLFLGMLTLCGAPLWAEDLVWAHPEQDSGVTNDEMGVLEALATNGIFPMTVDALPPASELANFERVWVILGTYPNNHQLSFEEGRALRDYGIDHHGCLYVSGGDTWGFDPQTEFSEVDGIDSFSTGDGPFDCDISTLTGLDSGQGLDLSEFAGVMAIDNGGECGWVDDLVPDFAGAAMINNADAEYTVTYHDGVLSLTPFPGEYRVICSSFEFSTFGTEGLRATLMARYLEILVPEPIVVDAFIRGDANGDGTYDVSDVIATLGFLFQGFIADCLNSLDANDDEVVDVSDGIYGLGVLFGQGPLPPPPFPACGPDPTPGSLGCASPPCP